MKPILFNTEMVRAILDGRKTQTRRVLKNDIIQGRPDPAVILFDGANRVFRWNPGDYPYDAAVVRPPYRYDDILWVRETWAKDDRRYIYRANYSDTERFYMNGQEITMRWHPSIHMPREAARIFLRVMTIHPERLQKITEYDARKKEGVSPCDDENVLIPYRLGFKDLWNSTINPADKLRYGWNANPWVWVIEFERIKEGWA